MYIVIGGNNYSSLRLQYQLYAPMYGH